jgi:hypothetical protein
VGCDLPGGGPAAKLLTGLAGTLGEVARAQLAADLADVARQFDAADDGTVLAPGEYLEAAGVRR